MAHFSTNLKVLTIHHDTILLDQIQQMCDRCHYLLTKCTSPSDALHLLAQRNNYFDIMLIDVGMPSMESYEFLRYITLQHNIPVIVMSSDTTNTSVVMESIIHGASDYWFQPLNEKLFKTMWQHAARKSLTENKEHDVLGFLKAQSHKEPEVVGIMKVQSPKEHEVVGFLEAPQHERKREREDDNPPKKSRLSWTPQLHQQFVNAVNQLGLDEAKPRKILKIMDVCGLTTAQVASHLQKYRDCFKRAPCGKKSKKIPRIDTPTSETEHAISKDQISQLNSLNNSNIETQQHLTDVANYQVSDTGYNYETQKHSTEVGDNQVSDIMNNDFPDLSSDWFLDLDDELLSLLF
ncbi:unnamed protein product [Vicia faba]|uniref:Uncharacterized protein n=1 Tax=Vicia faba TaxID=3906 RepID=A0AAV1AL30_VICFA|nr:unnamed protein product [Vicia faba]CAI8610821.1 unnamed protein product [Vicia faba]